MDLDEFRRHAHAAVDWMADYLATVDQRPVRARTRAGEILAALPSTAPEAGEPMERLMADVERVLLPGITHWQHPRFFAYFPANSSPPSVLAEMLTAALGTQGMLWETSPAANELETCVLGWLRDLLGLPAAFQGCIQDSGSSSTLVALLAARERAVAAAGVGHAAHDGLAGQPPLAVYTSAEAHSSVEKAARVLGIGGCRVRKITVDAEQAMRPDALVAAIARDRAEGVVPAAVVACLGATGLASVDPVEAIGRICARESIYLHLDAAWAGSALLLPEHRHLLAGIEHVDSVVVNPHKWLFTNFDCSAFWTRDPGELTRALAIHPAYLVSPAGAAMPEYRDWGVPLARRFRALKLWFVLRSYGAARLRSMLRAHITWTADLADIIRGDPDFELVVGPRFALLAFRYHPAGASDDEADALTEALLATVNADGRTYLTRTVLDGRPVIRFCVGQTTTEWRHVHEGWTAVRELAATLRRGTR
jgi:aromatic-L-amino-acid decarboxylase